MTTIAWDGKSLAFDSQTTCGNHRDLNVTKAVKRKGAIAATAGTSAMGLRFLDWFRTGMIGDPPEATGSSDDENFWGLIVTGERLLVWNSAGWLAGANEPYTLGSGGNYAQGAMAAGADSETAVEIAARFDVNTGGKITVLNLN